MDSLPMLSTSKLSTTTFANPKKSKRKVSIDHQLQYKKPFKLLESNATVAFVLTCGFNSENFMNPTFTEGISQPTIINSEPLSPQSPEM
jgi:hypothetical protein